MSKGNDPLSPLWLKLPARQVEGLKMLSHQLSLERGRDVRLTDLVREALDAAYPVASLPRRARAEAQS